MQSADPHAEWFDAEIHMQALTVGRDLAKAITSAWQSLRARGFKEPAELTALLADHLAVVSPPPKKMETEEPAPF